MTTIDYDKQIAIDMLEKSHITVKLKEGTEKITNEVKFKVHTKEKPYYVKCYSTGSEKSSSYVIKVYGNEKGLLYDNHLIAIANVNSTESIYNNGLQLEDKAAEQAITDVLLQEINPS